jgi:hypothetical protein
VGQTAYNAVYDTTFPTTWPYWGYSNIQNTTLSYHTVSGDPVTGFPMEPKAIQDEMGESFDEYGRMSGFLGLELPRTQAGNQNFILLGFTDPPVELIPLGPGYDGMQIWKITHNGVDTHPIHFHLYDVQLINRVGWDGMIRLPDPNELGWKDTVRVSPLEDTIVALRPDVPTFPFEVPNSIRLLDPTRPDGALLNSSTQVELTGMGLMSFAPNGEPIDIYNHYVNLGWEYVWHCHILSHEEMDMMHVQMIAVAPPAPDYVTAAGMSGPLRIVLNWPNNTLNATGFRIQRASDADFTTDLITIDVGTVSEYVDEDVSLGQSYYYRVAALNTVGDTHDYSDPNLNEGATFPNETMVSPYTLAEWLGMQVTGNSLVIANGDTTPSLADHTDFGVADVDGETVVRTFTIHNTWLEGDLTLDGDPRVELSGDTADFTVTMQPDSPVEATGSTTFEITFDPTSEGTKTATVSISNPGDHPCPRQPQSADRMEPGVRAARNRPGTRYARRSLCRGGRSLCMGCRPEGVLHAAVHRAGTRLLGGSHAGDTHHRVRRGRDHMDRHSERGLEHDWVGLRKSGACRRPCGQSPVPGRHLLVECGLQILRNRHGDRAGQGLLGGSHRNLRPHRGMTAGVVKNESRVSAPDTERGGS